MKLTEHLGNVSREKYAKGATGCDEPETRVLSFHLLHTADEK
jgi:hypothetical protein